MINANELRIGNYVSDNFASDSFFAQVKKLDFTRCHYGNFHSCYSDLKPIPITEEWLTKKFIFKQIDKYTFVLNGIFIHKRLSGFIFNIGKRKIKLNSIHQLQNLYFALTQKELTLNE